MNKEHAVCNPAVRPAPRPSLCLAAVVCAGFMWGCGGSESGPPRFHVEGTVTFDGRPVPAGTIFFQPDTSTGNRGPGGVAAIRSGRFDTRSGKGTIGGAQVIQVEGFDGKATAEKPFGNPLFVPYTLRAEVPRGAGMLDIDVPAAAAEGLSLEEDPA